MYKIKNKLQVNLTARGQELKQEIIKNGLEYSFDLVDENTKPYADEPALRKRLRKGTSFSWIVSTSPDETILGRGEELAVANTPEVQDVIGVWESHQAGFVNLAPGKTAEIRENPRYLNDLIITGFADKIQIFDEDVMIWDGGIKEVEYEMRKTLKDVDEDKVRKYKGEEICNLLHPDKLREVYYPKLEVGTPSKIKTDDEILEEEIKKEEAEKKAKKS
jgi:hypothetical protein